RRAGASVAASDKSSLTSDWTHNRLKISDLQAGASGPIRWVRELNGSWSHLHAFQPRRARVGERARGRPRRLCTPTTANLYRLTSGFDVDGALSGLECRLLFQPGFHGGGLAISLQWPRA